MPSLPRENLDIEASEIRSETTPSVAPPDFAIVPDENQLDDD